MRLLTRITLLLSGYFGLLGALGGAPFPCAVAGTVFQHLEMELPAALGGASVYAVEHDSERASGFHFGALAVDRVVRADLATAGNLPRTTTFGYAYTVEDAGEEQRITCQGERVEHLAPWRQDNTFLRCQSEDHSWSLSMMQGKDKDLFGTLTTNGDVLDVSAAHGMVGATARTADATGYLVSAGRGPIGAIDVLNDGRVVVGDGAHLQAISLAATSLLLFEAPIR